MRVLTFDPDDRKYERIYGWLVTGRPVTDRRAAKIHGAILDKFEAIGQVKPPVDEQGKVREFLSADELRFYVTVSGGTIELDEVQYDMVKERVEGAVAGIHPSLTREYERCLEWLESLPKQETAKAAPVE